MTDFVSMYKGFDAPNFRYLKSCDNCKELDPEIDSLQNPWCKKHKEERAEPLAAICDDWRSDVG